MMGHLSSFDLEEHQGTFDDAKNPKQDLGRL